MRNKLSPSILSYLYHIKKGGALLFGVTLIKSLTFLSPLLISTILNNTSSYGLFEYSFNLGQTLLSVLSMGLSNALPYFLFKKNIKHLQPAFHFHFSVINFSLLSLLVFIPSLYRNIYFGSIIIGAFCAYHIFLSSLLKLEEKNFRSIIIDSSIYIIMTIYAVTLYFKLLEFNISEWYLIVLLHLIISNLFRLKYIAGFSKIPLSDYLSIYKYGLFSVVGSTLLFILSNNTRIFIDQFSTLENVGIYSFFFRIASLVILIHRTIGILMYKRYFILGHDKLDMFFSILIPTLLIINILLGVLVYYGHYYYPSIIDSQYSSKLSIYVYTIFQVNFWIGTALFESIINREFLINKTIILLIISLAIFISTLKMFNIFYSLNLTTIISLNIFFIFFFNIGQILLLKRKVYFYKNTFLAQSFIILIFLSYLLIGL